MTIEHVKMAKRADAMLFRVGEHVNVSLGFDCIVVAVDIERGIVSVRRIGWWGRLRLRVCRLARRLWWAVTG